MKTDMNQRKGGKELLIPADMKYLGERMADEPIYFINQYNVSKHPKIWSKRGYWTFQAVSSIICIPLLVLLIIIYVLPVYSLPVYLMASGIGALAGFNQGRKRAERYKIELAYGISSPFYGKYSLEETRYFLGM